MSALHDLAETVGLARVWEDARTRRQVVADDALVPILAALGYPAHDDSAARASLERVAEEARRPPAFLSVDADQPLALPPALAGAQVATIEWEEGGTRELPIVRGVLPGIAATGYHRLHIAGHTLVLAVAPPRCLLPMDLPDVTGKLWGPAIQIPSLHDRATRYGDFADLRGLDGDHASKRRAHRGVVE